MGMRLAYINKSGKPLKNLQKVFFCAEDGDREKYMKSLSDDLFAAQPNISLWYPEGTEDGWTQEEREAYLSDLQEMNLFVIPVTRRFLDTDNRARTLEFRFAAERHIPVLPVFQEQELETRFNAVCGNLQCLNKFDPDTTALPYEEKLKLFLDTVLLRDETIEKIRKAFAAYIFLSYRKKDRKYAQEVMRLIHRNPFTRDIAIWYDEFLTPGEDFNESIKAAFEKSGLFSMVVTPSLLEKPNYVMTTEYPMAVEAGKTILPIMAVPTDRDELEACYPEIPERISSEEANADHIGELIRQALEIRQNDDPEHKFFMGLAYLSGIDLETDYERAKTLITDAAGSGIAEACLKLVTMYETGQGVERDYEQGAFWQQRYVECLEKKLQEGSREKDLQYTYFRACSQAGKKWGTLYRYDRAWAAYDRILKTDVALSRSTVKDVIAQIEACMYASRTATSQKKFEKAEVFPDRARKLSGDAASFLEDIELKKGGSGKKSELFLLVYRANILDMLGSIKARNKEWAEAIGCFEEAEPIYKKIVPEDPRLKKSMASMYMSLGQTLFQQDKSSAENRAKAENYLRENLRLVRECAETDTAFEKDVLEYSGLSRARLTEICLADGRTDEAESIAAEFLDMAGKLYEEEESVRAERFLALAYVVNSGVAEKKGNTEEQEKLLVKLLDLEEQLAGRVGLKNTAPQMSVYYKTLLRVLRDRQSWEKHRIYAKKLERLTLECYPGSGTAFADLAFACSKEKDEYGLGKAYEYYEKSLDLDPDSERSRKNLGIVETQLNNVRIQAKNEQNAGVLLNIYDRFRLLSEKQPEKEGFAKIRDKAEDDLAYVLSGRTDILDKEIACVYYRDLAERYPEVDRHANNLRIVRAQIALKLYRDAEAGDRAAAQKAYALYTELEKDYPDRDYAKNAVYVKNHFM